MGTGFLSMQCFSCYNNDMFSFHLELVLSLFLKNAEIQQYKMSGIVIPGKQGSGLDHNAMKNVFFFFAVKVGSFFLSSFFPFLYLSSPR